MKNLKELILLTSLFILLNLGTMLKAQLTIQLPTIGNGFGYQSNNEYQVKGTTGQPSVGILSNDAFIFQLGFWYKFHNYISNIEDLNLPIPKDFKLHQNYPNPFNPETKIVFSVPIITNVKINIYNILGERVINLIDSKLNPGIYEVKFNAQYLASGFYFYHMQAKGFNDIRKMILVK